MSLSKKDKGIKLRNKGIQKAINHADEIIPNWSDSAFNYLKKYIKSHKQFMAEDVRIASRKFIPEPPSARAWGGVIIRANKLGLIKHIGYKNVSNEKAHRTPASVWKTI